MSATDPDSLRSERKNVSVLKVSLARLRERHRCRIVIVLEGKDDLPVYETWIKRLDERFEWEPLVANGKSKSLEFRELLHRDRTGLSVCTYFIVDHDYDGMRGHPVTDDLFLLPAYSVENYLIHESVLESYLRTELRLIGVPDERDRVVSHYIAARDEFMESVREPCECLFGARNEKVGNVRVGEVKSTVTISEKQISAPGGAWLDNLVSTEFPISTAGLQRGHDFLAEREAALWIRGKFMIDFFRDFCELLYQDRKSERPLLFDERASDTSLSVASLDLRNLAAKSPMPEGLREALVRWESDCREKCAA